MISRSLMILAVAAAVFAVASQIHPFDKSAVANDHSATRSFSPPLEVVAGGELTGHC